MKCRRCGIEFKPKKWQITCYDHRCFPCKRKQQNDANANNPLFLEMARKHYQKRKKYHQEYYRKNKDNALYQLKKKARRKLKSEIEAGRIIRPKKCSTCKKAGRIQAHHSNYKEPLNVKWICSTCHGKEHRK